MKTAIFTSILAVFSGLVSSVPVPDGEGSRLEARGSITLFPNLMVPIHESAPWHQFGPAYQAEVSRVNGWQNVNTLLSYNFDPSDSGKTCHFSFQDPITVTGSGKVQLFSVGGPVESTSTFQHRPYRNIYLGTFNASPGKVGTWDEGKAPSFACPTTTTGYEVVPQNDNDHITWSYGGLTVIIE